MIFMQLITNLIVYCCYDVKYMKIINCWSVIKAYIPENDYSE